MKFGRSFPHEIHITPTMDGGFTIQVGCQTFVASNPGELREKMGDFLRDMNGALEDFNKTPGGPSVVGVDLASEPAPHTHWHAGGNPSSQGRMPGHRPTVGANPSRM